MSFSSAGYESEFIINDESPSHLEDAPDGCNRGLLLELRGPGDFEYGAAADPFPAELLIPKSEWQARIEEMEATKTRLSDLIRARKSPCKNQAQTNFCWFNSPTRCTEIVRMQQNEKQIVLSPASGACYVTNFRNVGGWGFQALQWIVEHGLNDVNDWPANAIDTKYATPDNKAKAFLNRIVEWTECKPRTIEQKISLLLRRIPVACGYNWWGHEVTAIDPVWKDGDIATREENSWGPTYGDLGMFILQGSKMYPDDAVAPRTALAS